ncbi:sugar ABC transporter substrate-binding protein [Gracilibacillus sp. YIM 98692]|uniref:sugar ABC transporter substrate-binding protein n=1 Tax=Gracilibacillus sp. YIM 98692 TaxID=2663532 RepID=UPI0013D6266E|nr:sugar ABC transporter substrate-binding protein [Gracilibacillus sp. YIM 98692]
MLKIKSFINLFLVVILITLVGCNNNENVDKNVDMTEIDGETMDIAWIGKTLNNPWWVSVADFAEQEAENLGVNLTISLPEEEVDLGKQVAMVESAIEKQTDAIVISATSSDGIIPAIEKARNEGIKIVNFDTRISDPSMYDAFVGADDVEGAYKAGKYIAEQLNGEGKVGLITGLLAQSTGIDRKEGFMKAMEEYPGIEVVAEASGDWRSDLAADATTNMLTAHSDIDAIFASNDQMAVGMASAAEAEQRAEDLILVGYDGIIDAVDLVLEDDLDAFVALPNIDEGVMGVRLAAALVANPDFEFNREVIYPTSLVTKENIEGLTDQTIYEYIAERFPLFGITDKGY